jgi:hypothetical protein
VFALVAVAVVFVEDGRGWKGQRDGGCLIFVGRILNHFLSFARLRTSFSVFYSHSLFSVYLFFYSLSALYFFPLY